MQELRGLLQRRLLQMLVLAALLTAVAGRALLLKFSVLDLDIWWHLKVGDWIVEHHAFPHNGILSRTAANRPWAAYSWGYEVLLSRAYAWFGLVGLGVFGTLLTLAVAYAVYWMVRRLSGKFWVACILGTVTCSAFLFSLMPRPVFLSMILFAVTLTLILQSQRPGRAHLLYWLPLVFLVWANCHIQFIYGIFVVGLFTGVHLLQQLGAHFGIIADFALPSGLPARKLVLIFAACVGGHLSWTLFLSLVSHSLRLRGVEVSLHFHSRVPGTQLSCLQPLRGTIAGWRCLLHSGTAEARRSV